MEFLLELNTKINSIVWGPPMIIAIIGVGVYALIRTRFIQFAKFGLMCRETMGKLFKKEKRAEGDVRPFQALSVAMGGTVGVGNIAGVATAIAMGGPGAIFWMWISGLLGMGTKFAEVVLGVNYRKREKGGPMVGGPMVYIREGMGKNWVFLAVIFALFGSLAAFGIGNMVQANSVADGLLPFGIPRVYTGIFLIVAVGLVTIGGIKRIANVAMVTVPFMTIIYILGALFIIVTQIGKVPEAFALIFRSAFTPIAATGGFLGATMRSAIRYGIARGIFSNEAGLGSAPMAHATAITDHPARQGLWGIFEVFVDTIIVCSATALAIIITGAWASGKSGAPLTMHAFQAVFGTRVGFSLVVLSMVLTAYDTILAWCFYGETCVAYLFKRGARTVYRLIWLPFTMIGALGKLEAIWAISDTLNGLMAIPNLIAIVALGGIVAKRTKEFLSQQINK
ncbi:ACGS family amino acid carrier protein [candidate division WOR_3 bacterium SM23_42]|uniref:ACGS family amino acid carrier protein n=1 Tax=candidate division WOR_3 bacterium SM23_42 TaxID=1703779 RepID=A0A0S8FTH9_UNCW3|nr:MAG: ACGS family amino acid carrier protein [candidate division WOR_3 bacterium SM23_42]